MNNSSKMFENFDLWYDSGEGEEYPFVVACKDREFTSGERWVLASLSIEEAKKLYKYLVDHLLYSDLSKKENINE